MIFYLSSTKNSLCMFFSPSWTPSPDPRQRIQPPSYPNSVPRFERAPAAAAAAQVQHPPQMLWQAQQQHEQQQQQQQQQLQLRQHQQQQRTDAESVKALGELNMSN